MGKHQLPLYAIAGDTFFTQSASMLGRVIRWISKDPGEATTWANHTGVVVRSGWLVPRSSTDRLAVVVEAQWHTLHVKWWEEHGAQVLEGMRIQAYGALDPRTPAQTRAFRAEALKYVGDKYGWWKLGFHLFDRIVFKGDKVVSRLLRVDNRPICSYLSAKANAEQDMYFGMKPEAADPDEMLDYCETHQDEWRKR